MEGFEKGLRMKEQDAEKREPWKGLLKKPLEIKSTMAEMKLSPKALKSEFKEISQNTGLKVKRWRM